MRDDKNYWFTWLVWWLSLIPVSVFRLKEDSGENCDADGDPEENTPREQTALMRNKKISMKEKYITISSYMQADMILSQIAINVSVLFPPYRLFKSYTVVALSLFRCGRRGTRRRTSRKEGEEIQTQSRSSESKKRYVFFLLSVIKIFAAECFSVV